MSTIDHITEAKGRRQAEAAVVAREQAPTHEHRLLAARVRRAHPRPVRALRTPARLRRIAEGKRHVARTLWADDPERYDRLHAEAIDLEILAHEVEAPYIDTTPAPGDPF